MEIFWGKVQKGDKRGRELGYPTANMRLHKKFAEGVYVSKVKTDGIWHSALTFIGSAKTFGKKDYKAETWIMDFSGNLYEKFLSVKLLKKLRGNQKFGSAESLIVQMKKDEKKGRKFLNSSQ